MKAPFAHAAIQVLVHNGHYNRTIWPYMINDTQSRDDHSPNGRLHCIQSSTSNENFTPDFFTDNDGLSLVGQNDRSLLRIFINFRLMPIGGLTIDR